MDDSYHYRKPLDSLEYWILPVGLVNKEMKSIVVVAVYYGLLQLVRFLFGTTVMQILALAGIMVGVAGIVRNIMRRRRLEK